MQDPIRKQVKLSYGIASYLEFISDNKNAKPFILLSPGPKGAEFYTEYVAHADPNYTYIALDFPGRGQSTRVSQRDSIDLLADYTNQFIDTLNLSDITILGISFGTAIVNEIAKKSERVKNVILLGGGEFLPVYIKPFGWLLIYPMTISERFAGRILGLLESILPRFFSFPHTNIKDLAEQYLSVIFYKIKFDQPVERVKAILIDVTADIIVTKKSREKLRKLYPNHKEFIVEYNHRITPENAEKAKKNTIPEIFKLLNSD